MFLVVFVLCIVAVGGLVPECGVVNLYPYDVLIVGGRPARRGEVPWHAGIYRKTTRPYKHICGGSMISNSVLISAAHCFWNGEANRPPPESFAIAVGKLYKRWESNMTEEDVQKSDVKEFHLPVNYQASDANYQEDIAIIIVTKPFKYTLYVKPVCVDFDVSLDKKQLQPGNYGKVAGWGLTTVDGGSSNILKLIRLPYIDLQTCIAESPLTFRGHITGDKFCAGYKDSNQAVCMGDSGGGLAFPVVAEGETRYYLRGVVSSAPTSDQKCNTDDVTTFTQLLKHEYFIKRFWDIEQNIEQSGCEPVSPALTAKRTGKKAWDKCIEYQANLVFPCSETANGAKNRTNRCHHTASDISTAGDNVRQNEFPHFARLGYIYSYKNKITEMRWLCDGSLLSEKFVLTTGRCVSTRQAYIYYIGMGMLRENDTVNEQNTFKVRRFYVHPEFEDRYNDVGLVQLEKLVTLSEFIVPVCLHTAEDINADVAVTMAWELKTDILIKMFATKFNLEECAKIYPSQGDIPLISHGLDINTQLCYNRNASTTGCYGDIGGPLHVYHKKIACMYTIFGVMAFGGHCNSKPVIYTRISQYVDWIEKIVWP